MMRLTLILLGLAWALAPSFGCGGGGVPPTPVREPLVPNSFAYHAGTGVPWTQLQDSEWDAICDNYVDPDPPDLDPGTPPQGDADCLDPQNFPTVHWDYRVEDDGRWRSATFALTPTPGVVARAETFSAQGLEFWGVANRVHWIQVEQSISAGLSQALYTYEVWCPSIIAGAAPGQQPLVRHYSWVGGQPTFTPPVTGQCSLVARDWAEQTAGQTTACPLGIWSCVHELFYSAWREY